MKELFLYAFKFLTTDFISLDKIGIAITFSPMDLMLFGLLVLLLSSFVAYIIKG